MIDCLSEYLASLYQQVAAPNLFAMPPVIEFRPSITRCPDCGVELKVRKTRTRTASTLHIGRFRAWEVFLSCNGCGYTSRSERLGALVPPVFPGVPDFISHFHFLRDIGKDLLGADYATIRKRLSKHGLGATLRRRAKDFKTHIDGKPTLIQAMQAGIEQALPPSETLEFVPLLNAYTLIQWAMQANAEGHGYGFPFDRPHLAFANRLRRLNALLEEIKDIHLRGQWKDNCPYFKIHIALKPIIKDQTLWRAVEAIEEKIIVFKKLREAMRIAPPSGRRGLNEEGPRGHIRTIEARVKKFRLWLTSRKNYPRDRSANKMVEQIDKYWEKLFADPITVETSSGPILIQPQRTHNILEQFFRRLKRANRCRTGNASTGRMHRTLLAETPLVRNLQNPHYIKLLLQEETSLEELFADIEIDVEPRECALLQVFKGWFARKWRLWRDFRGLTSAENRRPFSSA